MATKRFTRSDWRALRRLMRQFSFSWHDVLHVALEELQRYEDLERRAVEEDDARHVLGDDFALGIPPRRGGAP